MKSSTKSLVMLLSMLLLGVVIGAGGMTLMRGSGPREGLSGPRGARGTPPPPPQAGARGGGGGGGGGGGAGFVAHMEETLQPRDAAQRAAILPILEATDQYNRMTVDASRSAMRNGLDSMRVKLSPFLDNAQRARLNDLIERLNAGPPPPPPPSARRGPPEE